MPSHADHLAIRNTLARYCVALDTKDWALLSRVFVPDVVADYPFNRDLQGLEAVSSAIRNRLGPIRTHHSLTTQIITFSADGTVAYATTYFIGAHFGQGPHEGKVLQAFGRYEDELVRVEGEANGAGDGGKDGERDQEEWRVRKRVVGFTARVGDEAIMKEF